MKKTIFITLIIAIQTVSLSAKEPTRGYRGFIEWDTSFGPEDYNSFSDGVLDWILYTGISTSHGYQFNNNVYLGGGIDLSLGYPGEMLPVFADFRYDRKFGKFTPFGDIRLGYNLMAGGGIYFSPTIGYRFNWGRKAAFNIGAGCTVLGHTSEVYKTDFSKDETTGTSSAIITTTGKKHIANTLFTVRLGFDF